MIARSGIGKLRGSVLGFKQGIFERVEDRPTRQLLFRINGSSVERRVVERGVSLSSFKKGDMIEVTVSPQTGLVTAVTRITVDPAKSTAPIRKTEGSGG